MAFGKKSTLEMVHKAYEDLSDDDKKAFHQSIADRVHESIAAQERAEGDEDSQTAEDREHEALGAEHADERREEREEERREEGEERREERRDEERRDGSEAISAKLDRLIELLSARGESKDESALEKAKEVYGLGNNVFNADEEKSDKMSPKEAADILRKIKP